MPPGYVAREELEDLRAAVLSAGDGAVGITGRALALHGQGGIGKSVLAAALARDRVVREHFPDGVFWVTVGQQADLVSAQLGLLAVIFKAMQIAVGALDDDLAAAYASLAVYPEDTNVPVAAVARLWSGVHAPSETATRARLGILATRALLSLDADAIAFHDLQREFLLLQARELSLLHDDLLRAYRALLPSPDSPWRKLPREEPYNWSHLLYHLQGAGDRQGVRAVAGDLRFAALRCDSVGPGRPRPSCAQSRRPTPTMRRSPGCCACSPNGGICSRGIPRSRISSRRLRPAPVALRRALPSMPSASCHRTSCCSCAGDRMRPSRSCTCSRATSAGWERSPSHHRATSSPAPATTEQCASGTSPAASPQRACGTRVHAAYIAFSTRYGGGTEGHPRRAHRASARGGVLARRSHDRQRQRRPDRTPMGLPRREPLLRQSWRDPGSARLGPDGITLGMGAHVLQLDVVDRALVASPFAASM